MNFIQIKKLLIGLKENVSLKLYTSFKIGGKARYFYIANSQEQIKNALKVSKRLKIPFFILGGGTNILVSDNGFNGLVIKLNNKKLVFDKKRPQVIFAEAGVSLGRILSLAKRKGLTGLEWAAGIPGTLGGAIRGNAGAFGGSISQVVRKIRLLDIRNQKIKIREIKPEEAKFSYRNSIFKKDKNLVILSAELELKRGDIEKINNKISQYLNYRKRTQPLNFFSSGSIFKNIAKKSLTKDSLKKIKKLLDKDKFYLLKQELIPAGLLIQICGLKGMKIGQAMVSEKHCNFIVNLGRAKADDVLILISLIKQQVRDKLGIQLEEEIVYVGFKS